MYTIVHHYLTVGDDGTPTVERESWDCAIDMVATMVAKMIEHPGGRSGTTITLTVSRDDATSI